MTVMMGQTTRPGQRRGHGLPYSYSSDEKRPLSAPDASHAHGSRFVTVVRVPVPSFTDDNNYTARRGARRVLSIPIPVPPRVYARFQRLNPVVRAAFFVAMLVLALFVLLRKSSPGTAQVSSSTVVVSDAEIAKIWEWEIMSGHHPGISTVPTEVPMTGILLNPVVHAKLITPKIDGGKRRYPLAGRGPARKYIAPAVAPVNVSRPAPGTVIDMEVVLDKCDLSTRKHVKDCLEMLRISGNLDNGRRVRDATFVNAMKSTYLEDRFERISQDWTPLRASDRRPPLSEKPMTFTAPAKVAHAFSERAAAGDVCNDAYPRIFHMFWFGPFTDKPYLSILSFLFTQNLGLDLEIMSRVVQGTCRPQLWVWIEPGLAAHLPERKTLHEQLASNPWSAPFTHGRLGDVIKFKVWDTAKQLDSVPEVHGWRSVPAFNPANADGYFSGEDVDSSSINYARLVTLSHLARFVLTHKYGGIYLEPDTLFLRDWEEMWNYRGQFAYRHASAEVYNTAVLKMHRGSALGSFILTTGMANGGDFTPAAVSRYLCDARLDALLFRAPDALFDPAWLAVEGVQDRPPFPSFGNFSDFFMANTSAAIGAETAGFDAFFRGAFSYHFHNGWWRQVDPAHNYPALGPRFAKGENKLRAASKEVQGHALAAELDDALDLSWAAVVKRTFEAYLRGERGNMYGEMIVW